VNYFTTKKENGSMLENTQIKEEIFVIEVKNITKKYGKAIATEDISFTIKEGEIVGLLGPNGAGKSTTMNIITGFIEPTQGDVIINRK